MKQKILLLIPILLTAFFWSTTSGTVSTVYADTLDELQSQNAEVEEALTADRARKTNLEEQLQNQRRDLAGMSSTDPRRAGLESRIEQTEEDLEGVNDSISESESRQSQIARDITQTPERRSSRIREHYQRLIAANEQRGKDLQCALNRCNNQPCQEEGGTAASGAAPAAGSAGSTGSNPPPSRGLPCDDAEILRKQIEANQTYGAFLAAKSIVEECDANPNDPNCTGPSLGGITSTIGTDVQRSVMEVMSELLQEQLLELTRLEQEKNKSKTFKASEIFSLRDTEDAKRPTFFTVTNQIADWMITLVTSLAVTTLIIGGFMMVISGGDEGRLETGKTIFTYSLIGLTVTLVAFAIISFIQSIFL